MGIRQKILFGSSSHTLRFQFPDEWTDIPTGINIEIKDSAGSDVLASTAATIAAADTLASASTAGANEIVLTTGGTSFSEGDRLHIAKSASGPSENVIVEFWNSSTKTATLKRSMMHSHASGTAVSATWCTYALDASDADDYPNNKRLTVIWTPNNSYQAASELAAVRKYDYSMSGIETMVSDIYPIEYENIKGRFEVVYTQAKDRIAQRIAMKGYDIDKVKNQNVFDAPTLELIVYLANKSMGGDERQTEMKNAWDDYQRLMLEIENSNTWLDNDQDNIVDDHEDGPIAPNVGIRGYA